MFSMNIVDTDAFLDMPLSTQCLYFHLNMRADDDGFISNPKRIQRLIGASEDDLKLLLAKKFVLAFENGVVVIKHWLMNNTIRKDRYTPTTYQDELKLLGVKENNSYTFDKSVAKWLPNGCQTVSTDIDSGLGLGLGKVLVLESEQYSQDVLIVLPLKNDKSFPITLSMIDEYKSKYIYIDNIQEQLEEMKEWLENQKPINLTESKMKQFIERWLEKSNESMKNTFMQVEDRQDVSDEIQELLNKYRSGV